MTDTNKRCSVFAVSATYRLFGHISATLGSLSSSTRMCDLSSWKSKWFVIMV